MKRIKRKIVSGAVISAGALIILSAVSKSVNVQNLQAVPASLVKNESDKPIVIIDAGHGGFDGGCTSAEGVAEKGINLSILLKLRDILEISGYEVKVTRDTDVSIHDKGVEGIAAQKSSDMDNRLEIFNSCKNAICVSIHQNQFTEPQYKGAQIFYSSSVKQSEELARSLQSRFAEILQPDNKREIKNCGKELFLCYYSENPTVMAECGFMSNPEEAALLNTDEYQEKIALTIFAGISDYMGNIDKNHF